MLWIRSSYTGVHVNHNQQVIYIYVHITHPSHLHLHIATLASKLFGIFNLSLTLKDTLFRRQGAD